MQSVAGEMRGPASGGRGQEIRGGNTGDDANAGEGRVEQGDNSGGKDGRERGRERKRRHIGNNEGEGYVCVALSA